MKSTTSSSSTSSREERSLPKLLVSDPDTGANVLPNPSSNSNDAAADSGGKSSLQSANSQVISRKNSKSSLKSSASSVTDVSNMTKDEIIASMVKNRIREQTSHDGDDKETRICAADSGHSMTDQTTNLLKADSGNKVRSESQKQRKYSRSHQRRFHRRFPAVPAGERLIDWFNCALIADILLQGYLYISDHHFGFYSNIFGYKTQFLIPISNVVSVTKEKTARIFPNAVGICTDETKYVFGSLLSREAAYRLLQDVWRTTLYQVASDSCRATCDTKRDSGLTEISDSCLSDGLPGVSEKMLSVSDDDDDEDDEEEEDDSDSEELSIPALADPSSVRPAVAAVPAHMDKRTNFARVLNKISNEWHAIKRPTNNLFVVATLALVLLFLSAAFLLLRANFLYSRLTELTADTQILPAGSGNVDSDSAGDSAVDGLWPKAKAAILSWNRVRNFATKFQVKLREVADLRHELEQLLNVLKTAENQCS